MVFPDFKVVHSIPISKTGAQELYDKSLSPTVGRLSDPSVGPRLKSWVLPYEAVILLCAFSLPLGCVLDVNSDRKADGVTRACL